MDGVFSPEKNDAKFSHFGQVVLILEHVIPGHVRFKFSLVSLNFAWIQDKKRSP